MSKQQTELDEQFVNIWNQSQSLQEFCDKTAYKPTGAYARASRIRKQYGWSMKNLGSPTRKGSTATNTKRSSPGAGEVAKPAPDWVLYAAGVFDTCGTADIGENGSAKIVITLRIVTRNRLAAEYIAQNSGGQITQHDNYVSLSWPDPIAQHDFLSQICRYVKSGDEKLRAIAQWAEAKANLQIAMQALEKF